jgi:alpha-galactosidase
MSAMSCHFTEGACTSGRVSSYDFRYKVAAFGTYGYELDLSKFSEEDKTVFAEYSKEYREREAFNLEGDLYRLISPERNRFCAYIKVLKDKSKAWFTFLELNATGFVESTVVKLKGLAKEKRYKNETTGEVLYGDTLMNVGIRIGNLFREKRENGYEIIFSEYEG